MTSTTTPPFLPRRLSARIALGALFVSLPLLGELPQLPEETIRDLTEETGKNRGSDDGSLVLVPPESDLLFGLWRAKVLVTDKKIRKVLFYLDDKLQVTRKRPPFTAKLRLETYPRKQLVRAEGYDDDGALVAQDEVILNPPRGELPNQIEEVDVNLVELYTTVTGKSNLPARDLVESDFQVWEDGQPQEIAKFKLVENLPLTMGLALDTSGSMFESLHQVQNAAVGFLENIITPRDKCFALAFASKPVLLMPRTSDVGAMAQRLRSTVAAGATALHDAIVTSLYYYRGIRGRRALVILSDGKDTSSTITFREALEYAKRSGVAIYAIGLRIDRIDRAEFSVRRKLDNLAQETGGRTIYIRQASELETAYTKIERELRSQYLVAYSSDKSGEPGQYHKVTIQVKAGKLKARTMRGYYQ